MKRLLLIISGLLILLLLGGYMLLAGQFGMLGDTLKVAVEKATGKPLVLDGEPSLQFFPDFGLSLGKAAWGDPGKDEVAVSVRGAVVRVDVLELLHRKVVVNAINLDGLYVVLKVPGAEKKSAVLGTELGAGKGTGKEPMSLSSASSPVSGGASSTEAGSFLQSLHLQEVVVTDGELHLLDPRHTVHLSNLQVQVREMFTGTVGHADISLRGQVVPQGVAANSQTVEADIVLKTRIEPQYPVLRVQDLSLELKPLRGLPLVKPLQLTGKGVVDVALGGVSELDLTAKLAGTTARLSGHGSQAGPSGDIKLDAKGVLRDLLAAFSAGYTPTDANLLGAYTVTAGIRLDGNGVRIDGLQGTCDATRFSGQVQADWPHKVSAALHLDQLTVDGYVPVASGASGSSGPTGQAGQAGQATAPPAQPAPSASATHPTPAVWPVVDVTFNADTLRAFGFAATQVRSKTSGKDGRYTLGVTAGLFGSAARINAGADLVAKRYTLKSVADGLQAGPLFKNVAGLEGISGQLNLRTDLTAQGAEQAAWRRTLGGTAALTGKMDVDTQLLPSDWLKAIRNLRTVSLEQITVNAKADKGQVVLNPMTVTGKALTVQGQGVINLPTDALDMRLTASLSGLALPLAVRGTLSEPVFSVDAAGLIQNLLTNPAAGGKKLEEGVKNLLRGFR